MSLILYYSNYCDHCKKLLLFLSKYEMKNDIHYICIDNRELENNGEIKIVLANGTKILLPPNVTKVPALLLLNRGNRVLFGEEIHSFFDSKKRSVEKIITSQEPLAYSLSGMSEVVSDRFSFLDTSAEDLMAKGEGGLRMMHNYATLDYKSDIETPPESKIEKQEININKIQEQRNSI